MLEFRWHLEQMSMSVIFQGAFKSIVHLLWSELVFLISVYSCQRNIAMQHIAMAQLAFVYNCGNLLHNMPSKTMSAECRI